MGGNQKIGSIHLKFYKKREKEKTKKTKKKGEEIIISSPFLINPVRPLLNQGP